MYMWVGNDCHRSGQVKGDADSSQLVLNASNVTASSNTIPKSFAKLYTLVFQAVDRGGVDGMYIISFGGMIPRNSSEGNPCSML